jgi:hypothetical protein
MKDEAWLSSRIGNNFNLLYNTPLIQRIVEIDVNNQTGILLPSVSIATGARPVIQTITAAVGNCIDPTGLLKFPILRLTPKIYPPIDDLAIAIEPMVELDIANDVVFEKLSPVFHHALVGMHVLCSSISDVVQVLAINVDKKLGGFFGNWATQVPVCAAVEELQKRVLSWILRPVFGRYSGLASGCLFGSMEAYAYARNGQPAFWCTRMIMHSLLATIPLVPSIFIHTLWNSIIYA